MISVCSCVRLRPLDVEFMKALHEKVNIVPVLAKADTLTPMEVKKKKIKASAQAVQTCPVCVPMSRGLISVSNPSDSRGDRTVRDKDLPVPRLWFRRGRGLQTARPRAQGQKTHTVIQRSCIFLIYDRTYFQMCNYADNKMRWYVTLEHKTSHKGQFFKIEIYVSSESWINSFPLMYGLLW